MKWALPELVCCVGGNPQVAKIALAAGFRYRARLPSTTYAPVYFADQHYRQPNRVAYMAALERARPEIATVLDWERDEQLAEVLAWAEEASQYAAQVVIIPKVRGTVRIPERINSAAVVLGYSVPTSYGGTQVPLPEFYKRRIHLLGGSPEMQMRLWQHFRHYAEVVSVDGNSHLKLANRGLVWTGQGRRWSLRHLDGQRFAGDGNLEAFRRSCHNIQAAWLRERRY